MNMKGKIDLYAKIRREYRWGVGTIRGIAQMFKVHRRLVRDALDNPLPPKRKVPLRQHTNLAPAIPLIDVLLLADRDVPYPQRHSAPSIHHQIQCELAALRVAGSTVRGYVRKRKTELGLASQQVDLAAERTEVFEWMRAVQQGAIPRSELKKELSHVLEIDKLLRGTREGPLAQRKKAMTVLSHEKGVGWPLVCSFLHLSRRSVRRYWKRFQEGSTAALFAKRVNTRRKSQDDRIRQAVFALLHSPPSTYGINRTTWKMADMQEILRTQGHSLSRHLIRTFIEAAGYKWRKARTVLTSKDPNYQTKVDGIVKILTELKDDEAFFSIDEFGPFAVKKRGGRKRVGPEETYTVPQWEKSKGYLIITAALELSRNQITHFYSNKKNTQEMIKMMDLLRTQYRNCKTIYLSWDAASWHISKDLFEHIERRNNEGLAEGYPAVKTAPLPAGAQFLNVIESVFSGMARGIIHNSDYCSVEATKDAIDRYYAERNEHFRVHPKRAGRKIWGQERVQSEFHEANNCKDPHYYW
jgi:transposase